MALPGRDADALEWWKQNENELPLLAGVVRSYLAVTSASSERMFLLGGRLVTDFRHNSNPENTSMLVFVSQNYTRIPSNLKGWKKTCEGEPYELPHVTPPPPPPERLTGTTREDSQEPPEKTHRNHQIRLTGTTREDSQTTGKI